MVHLLHQVSEHRRKHGPYRAQIDDFFGLRLARTREINIEIRQRLIDWILDEYDVGYDGAEYYLREDYPGWHEPVRYHLCMIGNFFTTSEMVEFAAESLKQIRRTLPPGGTLVVMGGRSGHYPVIYENLRRQMRGTHQLQVSGQYDAEFGNRLQLLIKSFYIRVKQRVWTLVPNADELMKTWRVQDVNYYTKLWNIHTTILRHNSLFESSVQDIGRIGG